MFTHVQAAAAVPATAAARPLVADSPLPPMPTSCPPPHPTPPHPKRRRLGQPSHTEALHGQRRHAGRVWLLRYSLSGGRLRVRTSGAFVASPAAARQTSNPNEQAACLPPDMRPVCRSFPDPAVLENPVGIHFDPLYSRLYGECPAVAAAPWLHETLGSGCVGGSTDKAALPGLSPAPQSHPSRRAQPHPKPLLPLNATAASPAVADANKQQVLVSAVLKAASHREHTANCRGPAELRRPDTRACLLRPPV